MRRSKASKVSLRWAHEKSNSRCSAASLWLHVFLLFVQAIATDLCQLRATIVGLDEVRFARSLSESFKSADFLFQHPLTPGSWWIVSADRWTARRNSNSKGASQRQHLPYMLFEVVACQQYQGPSECNLYSLPVKDSITLCEDAIDRLKAGSSVLFSAFSMNNPLWFQFQPDPLQGSQTQLEKKLDTVVKAQTLRQVRWFYQLSPSLFECIAIKVSLLKTAVASKLCWCTLIFPAWSCLFEQPCPGAENVCCFSVFWLQEKAVQDRLIRETQDALLDKVSLAELNMFEVQGSTLALLIIGARIVLTVRLFFCWQIHVSVTIVIDLLKTVVAALGMLTERSHRPSLLGTPQSWSTSRS